MKVQVFVLTIALVTWAGFASAGTLHDLAGSPDKADEVRQALEAGENPNIAGEGNKVPLEIAATAGNTEIVEVLLKGGANVDEQGAQSRTSLTALAANDTWADEYGVGERLVATAELLIRHGANVNAAGRLGWTPVILSAANGNIPLLEVLLKSGADVDTALPTGYNALHQAAARGKDSSVRLLLGAGADATLRTLDGRTAMQLAEHYAKQNVIKVLDAASE